jgi:hypothetical protein
MGAQASGPIAAHPFGDSSAGDLEAFGDASLRPAVLNDKADELAAPFRRQRCMGMSNVRDEGLRGIE